MLLEKSKKIVFNNNCPKISLFNKKNVQKIVFFFKNKIVPNANF